MAGSKGFRVILDLSRYFQDHRKTARVFIRTDFKSIQDLQVHISNVFKIHDYYLTAGEHYLPLLEDIGVLTSEETICVIPKQENVADTVQLSTHADTVRLSRQVDTPLKSYKKYRPPQLITGEYLKKKSNNIIKIDVLKKDNSIEPSNVSKNDEDTSKNYVRLEINSLVQNNSPDNVPEGKEQNNLEKNINNDVCEKKDTTNIKVSKSAKNSIALDVSSNISAIINESASLSPLIENQKTFPFSASPFVSMRKRKRISEESIYSFSNDDISINAMPNDIIQYSLEKNDVSNNDINKKGDTSKLSILKPTTNDIRLDVSSDISPTVNNSGATLDSIAGSDKIFPFSFSSPPVNMEKQILEESGCYSFNNKISIDAMPESKIHNSFEKSDLLNIDRCKKEDTSKKNISNSAKNEIAFDGSSDTALNLNNSSVTLNLSTENDDNVTSDASVPVGNKRKRIRVRKRKKPQEPVLESRQEGPFNSLFKTKSTSDCSIPSVHIRFEAGKIDSKKMEANKDDSYAVDSNIPNDEDIFNNMWERHISEAQLINSIPKIGDVIAFKILKIGENYTPQITNNIIGKVEKYQLETKEISMNILGGLEELSSPFSESSNLKESTRSFLFTELIVPKLLRL